MLLPQLNLLIMPLKQWPLKISAEFATNNMQVRRLNNQISIHSLFVGFLVSYFNLLLYQEKIPFNKGSKVFWIKLSRTNCNPIEIIVLKISPGIPPIIPNRRFPKREVPHAVAKVKTPHVTAEAIFPEFLHNWSFKVFLFTEELI